MIERVRVRFLLLGGLTLLVFAGLGVPWWGLAPGMGVLAWFMAARRARPLLARERKALRRS
jgi:predicted ABC-type sugar transport system permease subunit